MNRRRTRTLPRLATLAVALLATVGTLPALLAGEPPAAPTVSAEAAPTLVSSDDAGAVFTKAFWRRPGPEDRILHALRREWLDSHGQVVQWQWFLVVEPSQETLAWLATNPFQLTPVHVAQAVTSPADAPAWFSVEGPMAARHQDATGQHFVAISADRRRLYATDAGAGFRLATEK